MKQLSILVLLLGFSQAALAGTATVSSVFQSGFGNNLNTPAFVQPLNKTELDKRRTLFFGGNTITANSFHGAYLLGDVGSGGAGIHYQVGTAAGTKLYCLSWSWSSSAAQDFIIGYATADFTEDATASPTGLKTFAKNSTPAEGYFILPASTNLDAAPSRPTFMQWSASEFPLIKFEATARTQITMDCIEQ